MYLYIYIYTYYVYIYMYFFQRIPIYLTTYASQLEITIYQPKTNHDIINTRTIYQTIYTRMYYKLSLFLQTVTFLSTWRLPQTTTRQFMRLTMKPMDKTNSSFPNKGSFLSFEQPINPQRRCAILQWYACCSHSSWIFMVCFD